MGPVTGIQHRDVWTLLLCTVRYAHGRRSYIVSDVCNMIRGYRHLLTRTQVEQIADETSEELVRAHGHAETLGDGVDDLEWQRLVADLRAPAPPPADK